MIGNIFAKRKTKRRNSCVDIDDNSQQVFEDFTRFLENVIQLG